MSRKVIEISSQQLLFTVIWAWMKQVVSVWFWFPKCRVNVKEYVSPCNYCQSYTCTPGSPAVQLKAIPSPDRQFRFVEMDRPGPLKDNE